MTIKTVGSVEEGEMMLSETLYNHIKTMADAYGQITPGQKQKPINECPQPELFLINEITSALMCPEKSGHGILFDGGSRNEK